MRALLNSASDDVPGVLFVQGTTRTGNPRAVTGRAKASLPRGHRQRNYLIIDRCVEIVGLTGIVLIHCGIATTGLPAKRSPCVVRARPDLVLAAIGWLLRVKGRRLRDQGRAR